MPLNWEDVVKWGVLVGVGVLVAVGGGTNYTLIYLLGLGLGAYAGLMQK